MLVGEWIAWPLHGAAAALRGAADALERLAAVVDPPPESGAPLACGDDERSAAPLAGTRERMAAVLERARSSYDAVRAAPGPSK